MNGYTGNGLKLLIVNGQIFSSNMSECVYTLKDFIYIEAKLKKNCIYFPFNVSVTISVNVE